jgi:nucleoside 2-deoxyribosyltransferase
MTKLVYLATPIDFSTGGKERLEVLKGHLLKAGHGVFCPAQAWSVPPEATPNARLQRANVDVLLTCSGLLAVLETNTLTIGVIAEIMLAKGRHIPIVVVGKLGHSWALPFLGIVWYESVEHAVAHLTHAMKADEDDLIGDDDD